MIELKEILSIAKCSVSITVNNHRDYYQTVDEYFNEMFNDEDEKEDIENSVYQKMIETNTIVEIQVYPNTPIGCYKIYHWNIDEAIKMMLNEIK